MMALVKYMVSADTVSQVSLSRGAIVLTVKPGPELWVLEDPRAPREDFVLHPVQLGSLRKLSPHYFVATQGGQMFLLVPHSHDISTEEEVL